MRIINNSDFPTSNGNLGNNNHNMLESSQQQQQQQQHQQQATTNMNVFELVNEAEEKLIENNQQEEENGPPKLLSYRATAFVLLADVVGVGILGLPSSFSTLGWVLSIASLIFWYMVNMKMGSLIGEAIELHPEATSYLKLADIAFNNNSKASKAIGYFVDLFLLAILCAYIIIISDCLKMIFLGIKACSIGYILWPFCACCLIFPFTQFRLLSLTNIFMILNLVSIILAVFVALFHLSLNDKNQSNRIREVIPSDLSLFSFFNAQGIIAFSYSGCFIYPEIISEMKDVKEFKVSLLKISGPIQFILYLTVGAWGYFLLGKKKDSKFLLLEVPEESLAYSTSATFLLCHMIFTYLVKGTILTRSLQSRISPSTVNDFVSSKAAWVFTCITVFLLVIQFILSVFVPYFLDWVSLLGAVSTPVLGFYLPIYFALKLRPDGIHSFSIGEKRLFAVLLLFMFFLFIFGSVSSIQNINAQIQKKNNNVNDSFC